MARRRHPGALARAQEMTLIAAVQNRFNLLDRSGVQVLAECEARGILITPAASASRVTVSPAVASPCPPGSWVMTTTHGD